MRYRVVGVVFAAACGSTPAPAPAPVPPPAPKPATVAAHPTTASAKRAQLETMFAAESITGWEVVPDGTAALDPTNAHGGKGAIRIDRTATTRGAFSAIETHFPVDFDGSKIEIHGFLRTADVQGRAGLWIRADGADGTSQFIDTRTQKIDGTADWTEYSVELPIEATASEVTVGVLLIGTGKVWADDVRVLVDGKPIWDAPYREKPVEPRDHTFDHGSGLTLAQLSPVQIREPDGGGQGVGLPQVSPSESHGRQVELGRRATPPVARDSRRE